MAKKRINIYVDEEVYQDFKEVCSITGETITSVIDEAMRQYTDSIKMIIEAGDKNKLMELLQSKLNIQMKAIEKEIDSHIKAKEENQ